MSLKARRYRNLERELTGQDGVQKVEMDEDYHGLSGKAAYSPYDVVITLEDTETTTWTEDNARMLLDDNDLKYDAVVSFAEKGDVYKFFVSLEEY